MKEPSAGFLNSLAMVWNGIVSPTAAAKYGKDFRNNPVGTGPFTFKEYRPRDQVVLEANEAYWRGKPKLAQVVYKVLPDPQAALLGMRRGEIHILADVGGAVIPALRQEANVNLVTQPGLAVSGVSLPCDTKPFDDVRVRRGAESGGGQGGDQQGAIPGSGGADDVAAAAGAVGVRPEREGLWL